MSFKKKLVKAVHCFPFRRMKCFCLFPYSCFHNFIFRVLKSWRFNLNRFFLFPLKTVAWSTSHFFLSIYLYLRLLYLTSSIVLIFLFYSSKIKYICEFRRYILIKLFSYIISVFKTLHNFWLFKNIYTGNFVVVVTWFLSSG